MNNIKIEKEDTKNLYFNNVTTVDVSKYLELTEKVTTGEYSFVTFILDGSTTELVGLYDKDKKEIILSDDVSKLIFK